MLDLQTLYRNPQYSPVAPPYMLCWLESKGYDLDYLLLLAHDIAENPVQYMQMRAVKQRKGTIILDNSLIELGAPASFEVMEKAFNYVYPDYVVLPDKLLDKKTTLLETGRAMSSWGAFANRRQFMGVIQGRTLQEAKECAIAMQHEFNLTAVGIPKVLQRADALGSRVEITKFCASMGFEALHLLGFSDSFQDDANAFRVSHKVVGIDSAVPMRLGLLNKGLSPENIDNAPPRGDFWQQGQPTTLVTQSRECLLQVLENLDVMDRIVKLWTEEREREPV